MGLNSISQEEGNTYKYKSPCFTKDGKPMNPAEYSFQVFEVKRFKKKIPIDINIKSIVLGKKTVNLNFQYSAKIESETNILSITDSIGLKLILGKTIENGIKKYVYKIMIFKKDKDSDCWRPLTIMNSMYDVYNKKMSINQFGIGTKGTENYFEINVGWIVFD